MSYVDAIFDRHKNVVKVVERLNGQRLFTEEPVEHVLYYEHPAGSHKSIFENPCKRFSTTDPRKFRKEQMRLKDKGVRIFESDIRETFRHLSKFYTGVDAPTLHLTFFDIEVDFDPDRGFAPTDDPFCAVTAITAHLSQFDRLITLALVPPTLTSEEAHAMCDPVYDDDGKLIGGFADTFLFEDEADLLSTFLEIIEDSDVLSGWNSEGYDIPYLVNRIRRVLGDEATKRLCLWGMRPREREYMKFGKMQKTYDLVGRVHLDYLVLYQKHVTQQQQSYKLDYIAEIEVGENKTVYEGTLDDLYKKDFFRFIEYNRQDVMLLVKIDAKRKYIELHNQIAHANCVDLKTTVGSVALVEMAIINEMHAMGFVVPDRKPRSEDAIHPDDMEDDDEDGRTPVVGAYVAKPKTGIHYEVACVDINSLYPSAIRSLNMSPETILGQVRPDETTALVDTRIRNGTPRAEAWEDLFSSMEVWHMQTTEDVTHTFPDEIKDVPKEYTHFGWTVENNRLTVTLSPTKPIIVDFEDGRTIQCTAGDLRDYIFNPTNRVCISANGTIFRTEKDGIIPMLLAKWYADRKAMQAREKAFAKLAEEGVEVDDELAALLS